MRPLWLAPLLLLATFARGQALDPRVAPPAIAPVEWKTSEPADGVIVLETSFPSPFTSGIENNDTVPYRVFLPEGQGPFPFVLVIHYFGATDLRAEVSLATELAKRGMAAGVLTLPYHLGRTPPRARSGELAIRPDPAALRTTMFQASQDARRAIDVAMQRPEVRQGEVGIFGTSLGAIVTALVYAVDTRVTKVAFLLGGVDLAKIIWSSSRVVPQRDALRRRGFTEPKLRQELTVVEPLTYLPRTEPASAFIIQGRFDTVVPEASSDALIRAIPGAHVLKLETGHYGGIFVQRRLLRAVSDFFDKEFKGEPYVAPKRIYAPTLRLGISADPLRGLDVGIGLDLFRLDKRGDAFGTAFLSPRGPSLFIGQRLGGGFSVGVVGSAKGASVGAFWST
ncbi:hypothetical protein EON81_13090, partial [bacterium]